MDIPRVVACVGLNSDNGLRCKIGAIHFPLLDSNCRTQPKVTLLKKATILTKGISARGDSARQSSIFCKTLGKDQTCRWADTS